MALRNCQKILRTFDCQYILCDIAEKRQDECGKTVLQRIHQVIDLSTADAIYHQMCDVNFRTSRNIPLKYATISNPKQRHSGRPIDQIGSNCFYKVTFTTAYVNLKRKEISPPLFFYLLVKACF